MANTCFNLINPLAWFVQNNNAKTTPSLRALLRDERSGADLKVNQMLGGRASRNNRGTK